MAHGQAERLRTAAQEGALICPVPGCPSPQLTTYASNKRREHFVHRHAPADPGHNGAYARLAARELSPSGRERSIPRWRSLRTWSSSVSRSMFWSVRRPANASRSASPTGGSAARTDGNRTTHCAMTAVFGLRPAFYEPPRTSRLEQPDDAVARDRARGDIILDRALFREMRCEDSWPLLLSVEQRQLGNVIPPGGKVACQLQLLAPACRDGVQHLVVHDLTACKLTEQQPPYLQSFRRKPSIGLEPMTPSLPWSSGPETPDGEGS